MNPYLLLRPCTLFLSATLGPVMPAFGPEARAAEPAVSPGPVYEQRIYRPARTPAARAEPGEIMARFRAAYPKLGAPRFLIYVNRELVDTRSGFKLAGREETVVSNRREASRDVAASAGEDADGRGAAVNSQTKTAGGGGGEVSVTTSSSPGPGSAGGPAAAAADSAAQPARAVVSSLDQKLASVNRYERVDREEDPFEYRQLSRDVELCFGRRLRSAGASLADQRIATALIADRPLRDFVTPTEGEQARKDREALARVADVAIEILIATRDVTVPRVSGPATFSRPEIRAVAIRLKDARVMGQATSADGGGPAGRLGFREIADATALQLMEDMLLGVEP